MRHIFVYIYIYIFLCKKSFFSKEKFQFKTFSHIKTFFLQIMYILWKTYIFTKKILIFFQLNFATSEQA